MCVKVLGPVLTNFSFSSLGTKTGAIRVNSRNLQDGTPNAYVNLG
jgi:hypothetical protein